MNKISKNIKSSAGTDISLNYYVNDNPKGLVQILHGMQEHKERYDDFAKILCSNGYNVVIHDHLGHGQSVSDKYPLGHMGSLDYLINDIDRVRRSTNFIGPYICFGHSMGSFLARIYTSRVKSDLLIACGTGQTPSIAAKLIKGLLFFQKENVALNNIQNLVLLPMKRKFKDPMDWISYNKENQERYLKDELCGVAFTKIGFNTLMDIVIEVNRKKTYANNTAEKILIISGEDDPVGDFTKGLKYAKNRYEIYDKKVEMLIYENMSHEILNESNNKQVYRDILAFINNNI